MEEVIKYFKIVIAFIGTGFTYLFGAWDVALITLIVFMILDYLTGVIRAFVLKEINSNTGFKGLIRKCMIFVILIVAVTLDRLVNTEGFLFRTLTCYFFVANEGISILENCSSLGVPIPKKLLDTLSQLKDKSDKEE